MRKFLAMAAAALVLAAVFVVFLLTFHVDSYRPTMVRKLEEALGKPVRLERLSLGLTEGLTVELLGLAVYADAAQKEPALRLEKIKAAVKLLPLLRKKIELRSLTLVRPHLEAARTPAGIEIRGLRPLTSAASSTSPAPSFFIETVKIEGGEFQFTDRIRKRPLRISLRDIDLTLRNVSPGGPIDFNGASSFLGSKRNVSVSGRLRPPFKGDLGWLKNFNLRVDFGRARGHLEISADIQDLAMQPRVAFQVVADNVEVGDLLPAVRREEPQIQGRLTGSFRGAAAGPRFFRTLSGEGRFSLENGVILNLNILRQIFQRLSVIPGAVERLEARLPESYLRKLNASYTALAPVDLPFRVVNGVFYFNNLQVITEDLMVFGSARAGPDGALEAQGVVLASLPLSQAAVASVSEFQYLMNAQGRMEIPVRVERAEGRLRVIPDIQAAASRLVAAQGQALIGELLKK